MLTTMTKARFASRDITALVLWYEALSGKTADTHGSPHMAEWSLLSGGRFQVYQRPERGLEGRTVTQDAP